MTVYNRLKQIIEGIKTDSINQELLQASNNNPDTREDKMREMTARMLLPLSEQINQDPEFKPQEVKLELEKKKTGLEVKQGNSEASYTWTTRRILNVIDTLAEQYRKGDASQSRPFKQGNRCGEPTPNAEGDGDKPGIDPDESVLKGLNLGDRA